VNGDTSRDSSKISTVLPAVPPKDGYTGKWDNDGKNITEDRTISAVYTEIPPVTPEEGKPGDPDSPVTGDSSNPWLWAVLLVVSGSAVIALTVANRKMNNT